MLKIDFINRARAVHGDKYDYSCVPVKFKSRDKIEIICNEHGKFSQVVYSHLLNHGCSQCGLKKVSECLKKNPDRGGGRKNKTSIDEWMHKIKIVHKDKYNYPDLPVGNIGTHYLLKIECPKHGIFKQEMKIHAMGHGCPSCKKIKISSMRRNSSKKWMDKIDAVHNDKYNYSGISDNILGEDKISIECPIHGIFSQRIALHAKGQGCPSCAHHISQDEQSIVHYLNNFSLVLKNNRKIIAPLELDIVLPEKKTAIEYCGLYWHSDAQKSDKNYHLNKLERCEAAGYKLITIFENEWLDRRKQVQALLRRAVGAMGKRVFARKLKLLPVSKIEGISFFEANHIQGKFPASICYGLFTGQDVLLAAMSFKMSYNCTAKPGQWELTRYAVKDGYQVIGGASRLMAAFVRHYAPLHIISYCDRRYFTGGMYKALGFELTRELAPDYWYVKRQKLYNKRTFRHGKFKQAFDKGLLPEWDEEWSQKGNPNYKTEREIMEVAGYNRIWDCGKRVFEWSARK